VLSINLDIGNVVLENGWDVDLWECAFSEDDQETSLSTGSVADNDKLSSNLSHGDCVVVLGEGWKLVLLS